jgi:GNAT superfamily N-acetyltransferase
MQTPILDNLVETLVGTLDGFEGFDALCLGHAQRPVAGEKVLGVTRHHPEEREYEISAPEQAGVTIGELQRCFDGADVSGDASTYLHPYFDGEYEDPQGATTPLFAEDLAAPDFSRNPSGLREGDRNAEYLLVARNEHRQAAGYIQFSVSLFPSSEHTDEQAAHAGLVVTLERIFVRQSDRSRGIGTALLEKAGFVAWSELRHIAERLAALNPSHKFVLHPYVITTWHSLAGRMAHYRLVDLVSQYRDAASDDFGSDTLEILAVSELGSY